MQVLYNLSTNVVIQIFCMLTEYLQKSLWYKKSIHHMLLLTPLLSYLGNWGRPKRGMGIQKSF